MFDVIIPSVVPRIRAVPARVFHQQIFKEPAVGRVSFRNFPAHSVSQRVLVGNCGSAYHRMDRIAMLDPGHRIRSTHR